MGFHNTHSEKPRDNYGNSISLIIQNLQYFNSHSEQRCLIYIYFGAWFNNYKPRLITEGKYLHNKLTAGCELNHIQKSLEHVPLMLIMCTKSHFNLYKMVEIIYLTTVIRQPYCDFYKAPLAYKSV